MSQRRPVPRPRPRRRQKPPCRRRRRCRLDRRLGSQGNAAAGRPGRWPGRWPGRQAPTETPGRRRCPAGQVHGHSWDLNIFYFICGRALVELGLGQAPAPRGTSPFFAPPPPTGGNGARKYFAFFEDSPKAQAEELPTATSIFGGGPKRSRQAGTSPSQYKSFCQRTKRKLVQEFGDGHCGIRSLWCQFDKTFVKKSYTG